MGFVLNGKEQCIVISFDGSRNLSKWNEILSYSKSNDMHFTFFISGVYFTTREHSNVYDPVKQNSGDRHSWIGYSRSVDRVKYRVDYINKALKDGHEIGCHLNGHHNGSKWNYEDWVKEFNSFAKLITNISGNIGIDKKYNLSMSNIKGFRAPELAVNNDAYKALKDLGYDYDSSISTSIKRPFTNINGVVVFPVKYKRELTRTNVFVGIMDYNWYYYHSRGTNVSDTNTLLRWENQVYSNYVQYFEYQYNDNTRRRPVYIAHHFSRWNNNIYWKALKRFMRYVKDQKDVKFVTYSYLMNKNKKDKL